MGIHLATLESGWTSVGVNADSWHPGAFLIFFGHLVGIVDHLSSWAMMYSSSSPWSFIDYISGWIPMYSSCISLTIVKHLSVWLLMYLSFTHPSAIVLPSAYMPTPWCLIYIFLLGSHQASVGLNAGGWASFHRSSLIHHSLFIAIRTTIIWMVPDISSRRAV